MVEVASLDPGRDWHQRIEVLGEAETRRLLIG
jgi:hypothetical protein